MLNRFPSQKSMAIDKLESFKSHYIYRHYFEYRGLKDFNISLFNMKTEEEFDYLSENETAHRNDCSIFNLIRTANRLEKRFEGLVEIMNKVKLATSERLQQLKLLILENNPKPSSFFAQLLNQKNIEVNTLIKTFYNDSSGISLSRSMWVASTSLIKSKFEGTS